MTRPLQTSDQLIDLIRQALIADPDPGLVGKLGQLDSLTIHAHPRLLRHVDRITWTCSCPGASPVILAALQRHVPGLQERYDLA